MGLRPYLMVGTSIHAVDSLISVLVDRSAVCQVHLTWTAGCWCDRQGSWVLAWGPRCGWGVHFGWVGPRPFGIRLCRRRPGRGCVGIGSFPASGRFSGWCPVSAASSTAQTPWPVHSP